MSRVKLTRAELVESMKPYARGAFITTRKLKQWLGVGNEELKRFTADLDYSVRGRQKLYLCRNVAEHYMRNYAVTVL